MPTEDIDFGYERIIQGLEKLGGKTVSVGVFADAGKADDDKTDLVDIAIWNEYGSEKKNIPARPFLRIATDENEKAWNIMAEKMVGMVIDGLLGSDQSLELLGNKAVGDVQEVIGSNKLIANAPRTIKKKKSDSPLIDTGRLRQSIKFKIEE